jgi:hypothetical protein
MLVFFGRVGVGAYIMTNANLIRLLNSDPHDREETQDVEGTEHRKWKSSRPIKECVADRCMCSAEAQRVTNGPPEDTI